MGQVTKGLHAVLSYPLFYIAFQNLMGAKKIRRRFVRDFVCPAHGSTILDIGCGPADILTDLPQVRYWGIDMSKSYIRQAKKRFGDKGHFLCQPLHSTTLAGFPDFDIIMALGVLHHLDDAYAEKMLAVIQNSLKPGGRFVSFDPCLVAGQNKIARFLVQHDRGQNVRESHQYRQLVSPFFQSVRGEVRHQLWIPYTHFMMECHKK